MINIIENTKERVTFEKDSKEEAWFDHDCSDTNLLKQSKREGDIIDHVKWEDGNHIASILHVYFKSDNV